MRAATTRVQALTFVTAVGTLLAAGCGQPTSDDVDGQEPAPPPAACNGPAREPGPQGKPVPGILTTRGEWVAAEATDGCAGEIDRPGRALQRAASPGLHEDGAAEPPCAGGARDGLLLTLWRCGGDDGLWHRITEVDWTCPGGEGLTSREDLTTPARCQPPARNDARLPAGG
jgi:hypothetical protein